MTDPRCVHSQVCEPGEDCLCEPSSRSVARRAEKLLAEQGRDADWLERETGVRLGGPLTVDELGVIADALGVRATDLV